MKMGKNKATEYLCCCFVRKEKGIRTIQLRYGRKQVWICVFIFILKSQANSFIEIINGMEENEWMNVKFEQSQTNTGPTHKSPPPPHQDNCDHDHNKIVRNRKQLHDWVVFSKEKVGAIPTASKVSSMWFHCKMCATHV